jgi:hypothetical protein
MDEAYHATADDRFRWQVGCALQEALLPGCALFASDETMLKRLFDKHAFARAAGGCGLLVPKTILLRSSRRLADAWKREIPIDAILLKRAFPGWNEGALVKPTFDQLGRIRPTPEDPWVAQAYIPGEKLRCYAVAVAGKLTAIAPYRLPGRVAEREVRIETVASAEIEEFVRQFVGDHGFTGQVRFDFVNSSEGGLFVVGGKPLTSGGVHLLPRDTDWGGVFSGTVGETVKAEPGRVRDIGLRAFCLRFRRPRN